MRITNYNKNLAILPLLEHGSVDVSCFSYREFPHLSFRDNRFPYWDIFRFCVFSWEEGEYEIIALYFFAFGNIYIYKKH